MMIMVQRQRVYRKRLENMLITRKLKIKFWSLFSLWSSKLPGEGVREHKIIKDLTIGIKDFIFTPFPDFQTLTYKKDRNNFV